jgi:Zn-dependent protease with chaperone function
LEQPSAAPPAAGPHPPIPGPVERTTFFWEQARHRRRTLRFSALSTVLVALGGMPISLVVTPLLFAALLLLGHTADLIAPLPHWFWERVDAAGHTLPALVALLEESHPPGAWAAAVPGLLLLVVPGMAFMLGLWMLVRALFRHAGAGGLLLGLGAREPRAGDLEEQQLVNLAAEMGIAAGLPPPRLLMLDSGAANAAAVGSSPEDATLLVTRGLLEKLDRDETQGVIGHLVGSVGNGDLRIALLLLSVFQTFGLLNVVLNMPFGAQSRRALRDMGRFLFRPRDRAAAEAVARFLTEGVGLGRDDWDRYMSSIPSEESSLRSILRLPFLLGVAFPVFTVKFLTTFGVMGLFGPALAALWRTRRMLADATAVQLTRNPDGLARGLSELERHGSVVPAGRNADELFIVLASGAGEAEAEVKPLGGFHPSTRRRIERLRAQGAALAAATRSSPARAWTAAPLRSRVLMLGLAGALLVLIPLAVGMMVAAGVMLIGLSLGFTAFLLLLIQAVFSGLAALLR